MNQFTVSYYWKKKKEVKQISWNIHHTMQSQSVPGILFAFRSFCNVMITYIFPSFCRLNAHGKHLIKNGEAHRNDRIVT